MQLPKRDREFRWNLNTIIQLVTLAVMLIGGVAVWVNTRRDVEDLVLWRNQHEQYHKERLAEVKTIEAAYNERIRAGEVRDNDFDRKLDNLSYRVTVTEQSAVTISTSIKELQNVVNKQAGDLQVVREILQRMEAQQRQVAR
nr:hypothetical protein REQ54_01107 [Rhizobium sp. Q54]